ncbi:hypothetical protein PILCRDRAFT_819790 [Piloderma croceum F 1598]|uniref:Transposase n=1 Tax=Piloderma croceum (strain F 1598) TaxID=765440 RepID=A0A0C3B9M1_PILCF|nr:hypothetical protein PILCRDRAFT_819790 [Piloderma croceum F 1598]
MGHSSSPPAYPAGKVGERRHDRIEHGGRSKTNERASALNGRLKHLGYAALGCPTMMTLGLVSVRDATASREN